MLGDDLAVLTDDHSLGGGVHLDLPCRIEDGGWRPWDAAA